MYYRRTILLHLIGAFSEQGVDKLTLQKLLFLFCQEQETPAFDFVPYRYGCFSFQAAKDLNVLAHHYRFIKQIDEKWVINQSLDTALKTKERHTLVALLQRFKQKHTNQVMSYVYDRYPYYTINSQRAMTPDQRRAAQKERESISAKKRQCLFTIGYEGKSIDTYLNILVQNNVRLLCDVRGMPLSMKYGFSKQQLKGHCEHLDILYEHIPALGIASSQRRDVKSTQDYQRLFKKYRRELPSREQELRRVRDLLDLHHRVALTCFEAAHQNCHRHCVSDYLAEHYRVDCQHV